MSKDRDFEKEFESYKLSDAMRQALRDLKEVEEILDHLSPEDKKRLIALFETQQSFDHEQK